MGKATHRPRKPGPVAARFRGPSRSVNGGLIDGERPLFGRADVPLTQSAASKGCFKKQKPHSCERQHASGSTFMLFFGMERRGFLNEHLLEMS